MEPLIMFQMCELSCSEPPIDRLSHVGLILKADSHGRYEYDVRLMVLSLLLLF